MDPTLNILSESVIGAAIVVHRALGPGFIESVYERALCLELTASEVPFERQVLRTIAYRGNIVGELRLDLLVGSRLVIELKAVDQLSDIHSAQVISYLKAGSFPLGLLINFNVPILKRGIRRLIYSPPSSP